MEASPAQQNLLNSSDGEDYEKGEKLYVTADKRGEKGGCKRPLCWTLLVLVVAAIVAIIVLAATGILFSSSPTTLEQYNTSVSSARALGGIGGSSHDHDHHHDHGYHDVTTTETHEHGPEMNDEPSVISDDNDMSLYVPRTVEGELTIDNEEFSAALEDPESAEYREFVASFTDGLKKALFDRDTLENSNNDVIVEVIKLRKGSVIVTYRIHWKPKLNSEPTPDLLTAESLKAKLDGYLDTNNRMINVYHVYEDHTPTKPVLDICQIDNNQCENGCEFDETNLEFTCTCPHGQILDMINPKKCMSILENTYPLTPKENTEQNEVMILQTDSNPITTKPMPEEEKPATELVHLNENDHVFDWKEPHHALPETTTLTDADLNMSHIFGHGNENNTEAQVFESGEALPEPAAEPKAVPEPMAEPKPEPEPTSEPNADSKSKPESSAEPKDELEPTAEPKVEPEPTAEPNANPEVAVDHKIYFESEPQPTAEPKVEPEPTTETKAEPGLTAEPKAEPESTAEPSVEPEPTAEPKLEPETTAEPKADPEPIAEPIPVLVAEREFEHEPTAEPKPNEEPKVNPEVVLEPKSESEESTEVKPDIEHIYEPQKESGAVAAVGSAESNTGSSVETVQQESATVSAIESAQQEFGTGSHVESVQRGSVTGLPVESAQQESGVEPKSEKPTLETSTEHASSDQDILGLEVIHIMPSKTTESAPLPTYAPTTPSEPRFVETNSQSLNIHELIDQANNQGSSNGIEATTREPLLLNDNSENVELNTYEKPDIKTENATLRVSISEPHIINEPSYEPKPEIISILSDKTGGESALNFVTKDNSELTTEHGEWLQDDLDKDTKIATELQNNGMNNTHNDSEQRSFKSIDIFAEDTTTEKAGENDLTRSVMPEKSTESEIIIKDEETTTLTSQSTHLGSEIADNTGTMPSLNSVSTDINQEPVIPEVMKEDNNTEMTAKKESNMNEEKPPVSIAMFEGRTLNANESPAVVATTDSVKEYSINEQYNNNNTFEAENNLMDALVNKNETNKTDTTTKKFIVDDGIDITFDTINMLYNRSSHSIKINNESNADVTEAIIVEPTTVSDWLVEPVTEINFEVAMNKMEKHETTESSNTKIDEIINNGVTKDDFEPDYLNNMSSNNNKMKEDIPLYGITHDYDSEDPRVKRVNEEKEVSIEASTKKMSNEAALTENNLTSIATSSVKESNPALIPIETTTIIEYIYKTAENVMNESTANSGPQNNAEVIPYATTTSTEKSEPAPVWENSEADKDLTVKSLETSMHTVPISLTHAVSNDEIRTTTPTIIAVTPANTASSNSDAEPSLTAINKMKEISSTGSDVESQTKVNNLNVTIYEISSHNNNNSFAVTNQHSSEFEDHETDMNPFLPEVENNKSLVKKLQEGHDIEPTTFNETQNENVEDRSNNNSESARVINNQETLAEVDENKITSTAAPATTEAFASFSELMKSNIADTNITRVTSEEINEEKSEMKTPVSSFLLDTDDLDKEYTTEHKTTVAENNLENGAITSSPSSPVDLNEESDYLSVVPIEDEKESLKRDYGSELNDISDSPKKSDRRTLDETKFDSVNDNEA